MTSNGIPVSGKEVSFSVNKTGATLSAATATTDAKGQAKVKLTATKPDSVGYEVTVKVDGKKAPTGEIWSCRYIFEAATVNSVRKLSDDNQKIALDESNVTLKYSFYDANGNRIKLTDNDLSYSDGEFDAGVLKGASFVAITKPSGAKINDDLEKGTNEDFDLALDDKGNLKLVVYKEVLDKEGDYEIRFSLLNGSSVSYKFNVKEQGDITEMTLEYDTTSLAADTGAMTDAATVKLLDAEGYAKTVELPDSNIKFSVDNAAVAKFATGSVEIDSEEYIYDGKGHLVETTEEPAVVTVTAIDSDNKLVATATINIVKKPSALVITPKTSYSISEEAELAVQIVDVDGKPVSFGSNATMAEADAIILSTPAGGIASGDRDVDILEEVQENGKFDINITSNKEGAVKVQVVLTVTYDVLNAAGTEYVSETKVLTGSAVVNFGAATVTGRTSSS